MKLCLKENNEEYDLDIKSFQVESNDFIFIRLPARLPESEYKKIKEFFTNLFPDNKVVVTSQDLELNIVKYNRNFS